MNNYLEIAKIAALKEKFPSLEYDENETKPIVYIAAADLTALLKFLRDDENYAFQRLENLTAVDWKTHFETVYHLFAWESDAWLTVKVKIDRDKPAVPSATGVFPGVDFEEREVYDLFGIKFDGHPNMKRILLADNFEGHPLRKNYEQIMPPRVRHVVRGE